MLLDNHCGADANPSRASKVRARCVRKLKKIATLGNSWEIRVKFVL